jgi:DNA helicase-2/ATP-dependent DNA helicase PcrA
MAMDFDDLVTNTVYLLRKDRAVLQKYRGQFHYVLVDEYQDTNESQFQLVKLLAQEHQRIFVVGDDDQSIYSWRGARIENILTFDTVFPGTKVFKLEQNYRSTGPILGFANAVINGNRNRAEKKLWTSHTTGRDVVVTRYRDDRQEADGVAGKIQEATGRGVKSGQMAILFRTNAQSRLFEEVLRRKNIHYILVGGTSFYERKEVKDCLAYLRLLVNPDDTMSCERILNVPARGIGAKTQEKLTEMATAQGLSLFTFIRNGSFSDLGARTIKGVEELSSIFVLLSELQDGHAPPPDILSEMLTLTGYIDELENLDTEESRGRVENINELLNALTIWHREHPDKTLTDFLEEITLVADIDKWDQKNDAVNLMTLHCAKGLEFEDVYIVGVEDGLLPSRQNFDDESKLEEECRLFYVGATRAMNKLECSYVNTRMRFGAIIPMEPSRFIEQVPAGIFRYSDQSAFVAKPFEKTPDSRKKETAVSPVVQAAKRPEPVFDDVSQDSVQYRMGQIVMHTKYGHGKIVSISGFGPDMHVTVLFKDHGRKQMMARFANLQAV